MCAPPGASAPGGFLLGWAVGAPGDTATTGVWVRVDPIGTGAQPEDDHTPAPGTNCFATGQGTPGGSVGENDVDNGATTLMSPLIDLDGVAQAQISYWRWYSNDAGASPNADIFLVDISNDDGGSWTSVETIGPSGPGTAGGWVFHAFDVTDFVTPTALIRLRFIASDADSGSIVEAAVDDLQVAVISCEPLCPADITGDNAVNVLDLIELLLDFGTAGGPSDINGDGAVNVLDLIELLLVFGTTCP